MTTKRKTKRRFTKSADGVERCDYTVVLRLTRDEARLFERIAALEQVSFWEALSRSAHAGIRDTLPPEERDYLEPSEAKS